MNDLLVIDRLGLTVYGRSPAYFPFSVVSGAGNTALFVADVDGDGRPEVVTERSTGDRTSNGADRRAIEVWQKTARGLQLKWRREFDGSSYGVQWADADNDGKNELITASDTVVILKPGASEGWDIAAELPNIGLPQLPGEKNAFTLVDVEVGKSRTGAAGKQELQIVNSPSDGQERGRGNAWIIVRK